MDLIKIFEQTQIKKKIPDIRPGDTIRIHEKIKEKDRERIQVFEGTVLGIRGGKGLGGTIMVRKIAAGGIGVERIFPFHMPSIVKMEVTRRGKVRRAKLYYLRKLQEKAARLKEKKLTPKELERLKYEEPIALKKVKKEEKEEKLPSEAKVPKEKEEKAKSVNDKKSVSPPTGKK